MIGSGRVIIGVLSLILVVEMLLLMAVPMLASLAVEKEARHLRELYKATVSMRYLAEKVSCDKKDDDDIPTEQARADIERYLCDGPWFWDDDDPRIPGIADSLFELLCRYQRASGDDRLGGQLAVLGNTLKKPGPMGYMRGLWRKVQGVGGPQGGREDTKGEIMTADDDGRAREELDRTRKELDAWKLVAHRETGLSLDELQDRVDAIFADEPESLNG